MNVEAKRANCIERRRAARGGARGRPGANRSIRSRDRPAGRGTIVQTSGRIRPVDSVGKMFMISTIARLRTHVNRRLDTQKHVLHRCELPCSTDGMLLYCVLGPDHIQTARPAMTGQHDIASADQHGKRPRCAVHSARAEVMSSSSSCGCSCCSSAAPPDAERILPLDRWASIRAAGVY